MAIPYPDDGADFRMDLSAAGFNSENVDFNDLASVLECSKQHARNMLSGWNKYSKPMRAKMKTLIATNFNKVAVEPVTDQPACKHCGETRQIVKANVSPGDWILCRSCYHHTRLDQDVDAVPASQLNEPAVPTSKQCRYILDSDPDEGEYRVMKIMAICDDYEIARSICNMFNEKDQ